MFIAPIIALIANLASHPLFEIRIHKVVAIEHGPIVVDVDITYLGDIPLYYRTTAIHSMFSFSVPVEWKCERKLGGMFGASGRSISCLRKGERIYRRVSIHNAYNRCRALAGESSLPFTLAMPLVDLNSKECGCIVVTVPFTIAVDPCTQDSLDNLAGMIGRLLHVAESRESVDGDEVREARGLIIGSDDHAYAPLATRLLKYPASAKESRCLCRIALQGQAVSSNVKRELINHIVSDSPYHANQVISAWSEAGRRYSSTQSWQRSPFDLIDARFQVGRLQQAKSKPSAYTPILNERCVLSDCDLSAIVSRAHPLVKGILLLHFSDRLSFPSRMLCYRELGKYLASRSKTLQLPRACKNLEEEFLDEVLTCRSIGHIQMMRFLMSSRYDTFLDKSVKNAVRTE